MKPKTSIRYRLVPLARRLLLWELPPILLLLASPLILSQCVSSDMIITFRHTCVQIYEVGMTSLTLSVGSALFVDYVVKSTHPDGR